MTEALRQVSLYSRLLEFGGGTYTSREESAADVTEAQSAREEARTAVNLISNVLCLRLT